MTMITDQFAKAERLACRTDLSASPQQVADRLQMFVGFLLVLAALGLWVAPGATWATDLMISKLVLTAIATFVGIALVMSGVRFPSRDVVIDLAKGEVRIIRFAGEEELTMRSCRIEDLGLVQVDGPVLRMWDEAGAFLADIEMANVEDNQRLIAVMQRAGHL